MCVGSPACLLAQGIKHFFSSIVLRRVGFSPYYGVCLCFKFTQYLFYHVLISLLHQYLVTNVKIYVLQL